MDSIHFYFKMLYSRTYGPRQRKLIKISPNKKQHVLLIHTMKAHNTIMGNSHKSHQRLKQIEQKTTSQTHKNQFARVPSHVSGSSLLAIVFFKKAMASSNLCVPVNFGLFLDRTDTVRDSISLSPITNI